MALGPVGVRCPSVGECQGGKSEVGGWVGEHPHRGRERDNGIGGCAGLGGGGGFSCRVFLGGGGGFGGGGGVWGSTLIEAGRGTMG